MENYYKFMFIGFGGTNQKDFKTELVSYIIELGGSYVENEKYNDSCTHFVCIQPWPCGIQKFLGACATGKWVLTPEYVVDSYKNKKWLAERDYEWGVTKKPTLVRIHSALPEWVRTAPKRNRMRKLVRHKQNAGLPFKKWVACVLHEDTIKRLAYEEILKNGGAKIKVLGYAEDSYEQVFHTATHIFSEDIPENEYHINAIQSMGSKCLNIDYIRDYILKNEKPKEEEYLIAIYDVDILKLPESGSFRSLKYDFKTLKLRVARCRVQMLKAKLREKGKTAKQTTPKQQDKSLKTPKTPTPKQQKSRKYKRIKSTESNEMEAPLSDNKTPKTLMSRQRRISITESNDSMPSPITYGKNSPRARRNSPVGAHLLVQFPESQTPKVKVASSSKNRKRSSKPETKDTPPKKFMKKVFPNKEALLLTKVDEDEMAMTPTVNYDSINACIEAVVVGIDVEDSSVSEPLEPEIPDFLEESSSLIKSPAKSEELICNVEDGDNEPYNTMDVPSVQEPEEISKPDSVEPQFSSSEEASSCPEPDNIDTDAIDPTLEYIKSTFLHIYLWDTEYRKINKIDTHSLKSGSKVEIPHGITALFNSLTAQYKLEDAMEFFISVTSHTWYPHPKVLNKIIQFVILNPDDTNSASLISSLFNAISLNQPAITPAVSDAYVKALCPTSTEFGKSPWNTFAEIISSCMLKQINCETLFAFYVNIFEQDFEAFLKRTTDPSSDLCMKRITCPVILQLFWSNVSVGSMTKPLEELLRFIYQSTIQANSYETYNNLVTLLSLVAECTRLVESNCFTFGVSGSKCKELVRNVFEKCRLSDLDTTQLYKLVCSLKPTWLQSHIISELIAKLPFITFSQTRIAEPLTLVKILDCYLKPIDQKKTNPESTAHTLKKELKIDFESPLKASVINRRNRKGETQIHIACIENQPDKLKTLLDVPGIDVNIRDFAGWTPLHEACNGGYVECVSLLLKYNPDSKNVAQRVKKDPVDLMAKSNDGTTPMHDAIANNHTEVVRCLLEKGGLALLTIKSNNGVTPLDQIKSDHMKQLIWSFTEEGPDKLTKEDKDNTALAELDTSCVNDQARVNDISWYMSLIRLLIRSYLKMTKIKEIEKGLKKVMEYIKTDPKFGNMNTFLRDCLECMKNYEIPPKELLTYSNDLKCFIGIRNKILKCKSAIMKFSTDRNKEETENELELLLMYL